MKKATEKAKVATWFSGNPTSSITVPEALKSLLDPGQAQDIEKTSEILYLELVKSDRDRDLVRSIIKRGGSEDRARELAPLVEAFIAAQLSTSTVPTIAPELYTNRAEKSEKADAFLRRVWKDWLGQGLYKNLLRKLDEPLVLGLNNQYRGRLDELASILPTKSDEVTARLEARAGGPIPPEKRQLVASLERGMRNALK